MYVCVCACVCVCVCVCIYIYIHTHTQTHTRIFIYVLHTYIHTYTDRAFLVLCLATESLKRSFLVFTTSLYYVSFVISTFSFH